MKIKLPKYVRPKRGRDKNKVYYYFDTGIKEDGKTILTPLPHVSKPEFGRELAKAIANRNRKERIKTAYLSVTKLCDLWQKSPAFRKKAKGTQTSYNHYIKQIIAAVGEAPVDELDAAAVQYLMDQRGDKPGAANQLKRTIGALYAWARPKYTRNRPTDDIDLLPGGVHEQWPEQLLEEALASDDDMVSLSTALLYFTAQRLGDMLKMQWGDIRDGRIAVRQEKTDKPLRIKVHERLAERLQRVPKRGLTILAKEDGSPYRGDTVRKALQAFARARGFEIVPHGLRKNAVNALLDSGCSIGQVQAISGQSLEMIMHYSRDREKTGSGDAAILKWERKT